MKDFEEQIQIISDSIADLCNYISYDGDGVFYGDNLKLINNLDVINKFAINYFEIREEEHIEKRIDDEGFFILTLKNSDNYINIEEFNSICDKIVELIK